MRVAVLQSNYIPWKGYFDIINDVDLFIFHDDLQYTKNDWRNRNKIQTPSGSKWLTVPCGTNERRLILDVFLEDKSWQKQHFNQIRQNYSKSAHYKEYEELLADMYLKRQWDHLYELNRFFITTVAQELLGCTTKFADSRDFKTHGVKHKKLLSMLQNAGASTYVSGPAAQGYIREQDYVDAGIDLVWKDYSGYPEYPQLGSEFCHNLSVVDLLLNMGDNATDYIWGWRAK